MDISFDHRPTVVDNSFTYDDLNRLTGVEYLSNLSDTESFTMDVLGNRTSAALRGESSKTYAVNELTNRYNKTGTFDLALTYDAAGNTTTDENGYQYYYDYEQRIIKIEDVSYNTIVTFEYDALGRRIEKNDYASSEVTLYYYNDKWQVLAETGIYFTVQKKYIYGNYIDEVLYMDDGTNWYYYAHNHLFSTVALLDKNGDIAERYEYNAYGKATVYTDMTDWYTSTPTTASASQVGNPYLFTGRRLDTFEMATNYEIMYYRNRYYNTYTGRFLTQDPMEYVDGLNMYEYVISDPIAESDPLGLFVWSKWYTILTHKVTKVTKTLASDVQLLPPIEYFIYSESDSSEECDCVWPNSWYIKETHELSSKYDVILYGSVQAKIRFKVNFIGNFWQAEVKYRIGLQIPMETPDNVVSKSDPLCMNSYDVELSNMLEEAKKDAYIDLANTILKGKKKAIEDKYKSQQDNLLKELQKMAKKAIDYVK